MPGAPCQEHHGSSSQHLPHAALAGCTARHTQEIESNTSRLPSHAASMLPSHAASM
eukprot:CAMPEP_0202899756 /NCGR_PEP_ID=MMETSP1392-20130828/8126_1 /ASSEMBLY_ACC=CAM_ASM_000868 /TAXON_ID=225041 /ORGANISM="Chlamydomonas chlamydogama, Strain SAG 11-48b" /LENGTH=55 /DNA_ID=CAMNT_0049586013 /DNA_START=23 /DNA_END=187 /DNA_ORIENTATION=-